MKYENLMLQKGSRPDFVEDALVFAEGQENAVEVEEGATFAQTAMRAVKRRVRLVQSHVNRRRRRRRTNTSA